MPATGLVWLGVVFSFRAEWVETRSAACYQALEPVCINVRLLAPVTQAHVKGWHLLTAAGRRRVAAASLPHNPSSVVNGMPVYYVDCGPTRVLLEPTTTRAEIELIEPTLDAEENS